MFLGTLSPTWHIGRVPKVPEHEVFWGDTAKRKSPKRVLFQAAPNPKPQEEPLIERLQEHLKEPLPGPLQPALAESLEEPFPKDQSRGTVSRATPLGWILVTTSCRPSAERVLGFGF